MEFMASDDRLLCLERELWAEGFVFIAGVDEVGRGPLAGPVVAAAVILPRGAAIPRVNDSKQLTEPERGELDRAIRGVPGIRIGLARVDAATIDEINILQATHRAMFLAAGQLEECDFVLVDGRPVRGFGKPSKAVVKGDAKSASIAAASIVAKVYRDRLMVEWDREFPGYGFAGHKGYGTAGHLRALRELGPCGLHRRSFAPVRALLEPEQPNLL